jgi:hypothetical protein
VSQATSSSAKKTCRIPHHGECQGVRAALRGTRFEATQCLREAIRTVKGRCEKGIAEGAKLRHDHWISGRIGYRTPAAHRRILQGEAAWTPLSTCLGNCRRYRWVGG